MGVKSLLAFTSSTSATLMGRARSFLSKVKIGLDKILALGEIHEAGGKISVKPETVRTMLEWPIPQSTTGALLVLGTVITTRRGVKNHAESARPSQRLTGKVEWPWGEAKQSPFD